MPKRKLPPSLKRLVLKEKKKAPYLGVRGLADILSRKHKIKLSKSSIHNILKDKGFRDSLGRKRAVLAYKGRTVEPCGLMLLRALDSQIGLFDHLAESLERYLPDLDSGTIKKLVILSSFSFFSDRKLSKSLAKSGFLRVVGLSQIPSRKIKYFNQAITKYKPVVSLTKLKQDLVRVTAVKFYFKDGSQGFTDARLSTFFPKPPQIVDFSLPLRVCRNRLTRMFAQKLLIVGYTRSFNYLSETAFNFAKGVRSGVSRVELLSSKGEIRAKLKPASSELSFVFGYSPQILNPPTFPKTRNRKFRAFFDQQLGQFYLLSIPATFSSSKQNQELRLENIQIKQAKASSIVWGLLGFLGQSNRPAVLANRLTQYLYFWPYILEDFFKEVEATKRKTLLGLARGNPEKILPEKLNFIQPIDFIRVGQMLSAIFKELVGGWEPKAKSGTFYLRKGYVKIALKSAPLKLKKAFNQSGFYIDDRRVFLE